MKKTLQDVLKKYGVMHLEKNILDTLEQTIQIHLCRESDEKIAVGTSKFGGFPDFPDELEIPMKNDISLHFIGQLNLEEVQPYHKGNPLPTKGMLYFFYDAEEQPWGFDPKDIGGHRVLYTENIEKLKRREITTETFPPSLISFQETWTLTKEKIGKTGLSDDDEWDFYKEIEEVYIGEGYNGLHHLLGSAQAIQSEEMAEECHLVTQGFYLGNAYPSNKEGKRLSGSSRDWMLLLQIDTNDESQMYWGDTGLLYFWIKKEDLLQKNFENTWLILQCC
ncbi:YwqG family protein [Bacillus sp. UNC322MFChir4.1]|uniref:YwqG family protein n=1 Tax=Bacillus sp. UNC322MFChir4.1 TaxID=1449045 RepID=UPI00054F41A4|nr:YwqG family protein [Bacillus sp. UNC322MFChir4.1]